jgi:hypothetical protein
VRTRRQWLKQAIAVGVIPAMPRVGAAGPSPSVQFREERHRLHRESAAGFRLLLQSGETQPDGRIIIASGVQQLRLNEALQLSLAAKRGQLLILETGLAFPLYQWVVNDQITILNDVFDLGVRAPIDPEVVGGALQVAYRWPVSRLTRTFGWVTPADGDKQQVLASFRHHPICLAKHWGSGMLVYLGSMLGPNLYAGEREASEIGRALLRLNRQSRSSA